MNYLKLNENKTEMLLLGSHSNLRKHQVASIRIGDVNIVSETEVKNLGTIFDSTLNMDKFISAKCSSAAYYLRCISRIRKCLDTSSTRTLVHALVTSRIDYANSLLISASKTSLARLKVIQNSAARLIAQASRMDSVTLIRKELHWLPIHFRVQFKILVICFNYIQKTAPSYLCELITPYHTSRTLRSSGKMLLKIPAVSTKFAEKCFHVRAPQLWNSLPETLRSCDNISLFKSKLKTHLFREAYN